MTWRRNVLVVASATAASPEMLAVLRARAARGPVAFTLLVPTAHGAGGRAAARERLEQALASIRASGLEADGVVGHEDPVVAVTDAWDPRRFDEIVVGTLPMRVSTWLHAGLPERIGKLTGAPVTHVVSEPPRHEVEPGPPPPHDRASDVMGPFSVLAWGRPKRD